MNEYGIISIDSNIKIKMNYVTDRVLTVDKMCSLIGHECKDLLVTNPPFLYAELGCNFSFKDESRQVVGIVLDKSGVYTRQEINPIGSLIVSSLFPMRPVCGTILFVGLEKSGIEDSAVGLEMCDETLRLYKLLRGLCREANAIWDVIKEGKL